MKIFLPDSRKRKEILERSQVWVPKPLEARPGFYSEQLSTLSPWSWMRVQGAFPVVDLGFANAGRRDLPVGPIALCQSSLLPKFWFLAGTKKEKMYLPL